jgi:alpha-maltose-1-phosphate synthase
LWAELADRRRLLKETAPVPDRSPATLAMAHLPRPDPFLLFAGYPSGLLEPDMVVSLTPGATPQQVEACHKSPLADFAMAILPELADMIAVVRHLAADGPMTAAELAEAVAPGRSDRLYRGFVWMAKMDLVRIAPPAEPARDTIPSG